MKKVITILITLALLLSLPAPALAESAVGFSDEIFAALATDEPASDVDAPPEHERRSGEKISVSFYAVPGAYFLMNVYVSIYTETLWDIFDTRGLREYENGDPYADFIDSLEELAETSFGLFREQDPDGTFVLNILGGDDYNTLLATYVNGNKTFYYFDYLGRIR